MPAPQFDVLAQMDIAPNGNVTTLYTPPSGRAAVIAGVRVVSKWPSVESLTGAYLYSIDNDGVMSLATDSGFNQWPFPGHDLHRTVYNGSTDYTYFAKQVQTTYGNFIDWYIRSEISSPKSYAGNASLSVFKVNVGNEPITGLLLAPLVGNHLDIKVPVVTSQKPLKITNGIFTPRVHDDRLKAHRQQIINNHRKRCSTLTVTVFGQLIDNN